MKADLIVGVKIIAGIVRYIDEKGPLEPVDCVGRNCGRRKGENAGVLIVRLTRLKMGRAKPPGIVRALNQIPPDDGQVWQAQRCWCDDLSVYLIA
jgi:hypothetical protein